LETKNDDEIILKFASSSKYAKKFFKYEALDAIKDIFLAKTRIDMLQLFFPIFSLNDLDDSLRVKLQNIKDKNIKIEVYLQENISENLHEVKEFFRPFSIVYIFKDKK